MPIAPIVAAMTVLTSPPVPYPAAAAVEACGIRAELGMVVEPETDISYVRVVTRGRVSEAQLACLAKSPVNRDVELRFEGAVQGRYQAISDRVAAAARRAGARAWLARHRLLAKLPRYRPGRTRLALHARRLERLCGVKAGAMLDARADGLTVSPDWLRRQWVRPERAASRRYECILNAASASGIDFYFVGNEAAPPREAEPATPP